MKTLLIVLFLLVDEIAVVLVVFFVLRNLGVNLPLWVLIPLLVGVAAFSVIFYRFIAPVLKKKPLTGRETMIGLEGKVVTPLTPKGYIKVRGELWKALSTDTAINTDEEVTVVGLEGLKLLVRCKNDADSGEGMGEEEAVEKSTLCQED